MFLLSLLAITMTSWFQACGENKWVWLSWSLISFSGSSVCPLWIPLQKQCSAIQEMRAYCMSPFFSPVILGLKTVKQEWDNSILASFGLVPKKSTSIFSSRHFFIMNTAYTFANCFRDLLWSNLWYLLSTNYVKCKILIFKEIDDIWKNA